MLRQQLPDHQDVAQKAESSFIGGSHRGGNARLKRDTFTTTRLPALNDGEGARDVDPPQRYCCH
jgi:hypothetical protein